jgi:hypothetical protein
MTQDVNPHEWDFRNIKDPEVAACHAYEFAREVQEVVDRIKELRDSSNPKDFESFLGISRELHLGHYSILLWYPEWPGTPYLSIDEKIRVRRIKILSRDKPSKPSNRELASRLRPLPSLPHTYLPKSPLSEAALAKLNQSRVEIVIRPEFTPTELTEALWALLKLDFPKQGKGRPQGRAAGTAPQRHALEALGIYRLLRRMNVGQARTFLKEKKGQQISERALYRFRADAQDKITKFERNALSGLAEGGYVDLVVLWVRARGSFAQWLATRKPEELGEALRKLGEAEQQRVLREVIDSARGKG